MATDYDARRWATELLGPRYHKALTKQERTFLRRVANGPHIETAQADLVAVIHTRAESYGNREPSSTMIAGFQNLKADVDAGNPLQTAVWAD